MTQQSFLIQRSPQNWITCVKLYRIVNRSTLITMTLFMISSRILQNTDLEYLTKDAVEQEP
ncbi:hypothetical protein DY000_02062352 [Brassica cretica]|uniref:Uncharacterized protein n=1 Tax=Brassica cretica TaxID=69181 RepID=A0ABQ7AW06_BRACR|nr:hypothetical protein DY000_02062352 [Brassica cretica]